MSKAPPRDSAKQTFDTAIERARYILQMANALTDHRKRSARSDWCARFKEIMHWPQGYQIDRVDSKEVVLVLRNGSTLTRGAFAAEKLDDLLRASFVMAVSAMDAYFHAKILRYVVQCSKYEHPPDKLLNQKILVSDFISARQKTRTNHALRAAIERTLSYQSLQSPATIADALNLIGISGFWASAAKILKKDKEDLVEELTQAVRRRNQIAHEGDLSQSKKARNRSRAITPKNVGDAIDLLTTLIKASEKVICPQPSGPKQKASKSVKKKGRQ